MGTYSSGHIFEEFVSVKNMVFGDETVYGNLHKTLIKLLENYFQSLKWAKNDNEKGMYLRSGKNLSTAEIASSLNMNPNSYRAMVSRVSKRLRDVLFEGSDLRKILLGGSDDEIKKCIKHIEFINLNLDFYGEYSAEMLNLIETQVNTDGVAVPEPTEQELFNALIVLGAYREGTIERRLKALNPKALKAVIDNLSAKEYNVWIGYYQKLGYGSPDNLSQDKIERIKAAEQWSKL